MKDSVSYKKSYVWIKEGDLAEGRISSQNILMKKNSYLIVKILRIMST